MDPEGFLGRAPLAVFALVAGADGTIDADEVRTFVAGVDDQLQETRLVGAEVSALLLREGSALIGVITAQSKARNLEDIQQAGFLMDRLLGADAIVEKLALLQLGRRVADVSDGVDAEESQALDLIEVALGLG